MNTLIPTYKQISVDDFLQLLDTENYTEFAKLHKGKKWVKYHMIYCIEKNKYFVYPYELIVCSYLS